MCLANVGEQTHPPRCQHSLGAPPHVPKAATLASLHLLANGVIVDLGRKAFGETEAALAARIEEAGRRREPPNDAVDVA